MKAKCFLAVMIIWILAATTGCSADETPTPASNTPRIIACEYIGYYMSGWELKYEGGVIRADGPLGTGSEMVNAYIKPDGEEERLLTRYMGVATKAYLCGDWLYFSYADTDNGIYDTCRIDITELNEPEPLGVTLRFATDDFLYYWKDHDSTNIYRRDANFENEVLALSKTHYHTGIYPAKDRIVFVNEEFGEHTVIVYNQQGKELFSTKADISKLWNYHVYGDAFYWFDHADTPDAPLRIHSINLYTGKATSFADTYIDIEGFPTSIVDIDEQGIYLKINVPFPEKYNGPDPFPNTKLYRIPHSGGSAEFLREWYES